MDLCARQPNSCSSQQDSCFSGSACVVSSIDFWDDVRLSDSIQDAQEAVTRVLLDMLYDCFCALASNALYLTLNSLIERNSNFIPLHFRRSREVFATLLMRYVRLNAICIANWVVASLNVKNQKQWVGSADHLLTSRLGNRTNCDSQFHAAVMFLSIAGVLSDMASNLPPVPDESWESYCWASELYNHPRMFLASLTRWYSGGKKGPSEMTLTGWCWYIESWCARAFAGLGDSVPDRGNCQLFNPSKQPLADHLAIIAPVMCLIAQCEAFCNIGPTIMHEKHWYRICFILQGAIETCVLWERLWHVGSSGRSKTS